MAKCVVCGKDSGKGKTCGSTCRQRLRRKIRGSVTKTDSKCDNVTVETKRDKPENYGQPDCQCVHCQNNRANGNKHILNHGKYKPAAELGHNELNRVSLPGDVDYTGVCLDSKYDSRRIVVNASDTAVSGQTA